MTLSCGDCDDSFVTSPVLTVAHKRLSSSQQDHYYQSMEQSCSQELNEHYDSYDSKENSKYRKQYDDRYDENINEKFEMPIVNSNRRNSRKRNDYDDENRDIKYNNMDLNYNHERNYYNTNSNNDFCNEMTEISPFSKKRVSLAIHENT